jgi:hypothetical protein
VDILARRPHIPVEYPPADPVPNIKIVELDIFKHSAWIQATVSACHVPSSLKLLIEMVKYMWSLIHAASQVVMTVGNSSMAIKATLFNKKNVFHFKHYCICLVASEYISITLDKYVYDERMVVFLYVCDGGDWKCISKSRIRCCKIIMAMCRHMLVSSVWRNTS